MLKNRLNAEKKRLNAFFSQGEHLDYWKAKGFK